MIEGTSTVLFIMCTVPLLAYFHCVETLLEGLLNVKMGCYIYLSVPSIYSEMQNHQILL